MPITANTIWSGALPLGYRYVGVHVVLELTVEIFLIWILLRKRIELRSVTLWVIVANMMSFIIGSLVLMFFFVPKNSVLGISFVWILAFSISWVIESQIFNFRTKSEPLGGVWRATFWANVASYTIAYILFQVHIGGSYVPGLLFR